MTFEESLAYLYSAGVFGSRPGLQRIAELLRRLGHPEKQYPIVHIAGTNGKGSVSSFCAHIAAAKDWKCGWYTSPYLERFNERIRLIDGRAGLERFEQNYRSPEIPDSRFAAIMTEIREQVERMLQDGFDHPTVFELETAAALLWYAQEKVDLVVLEVGMGGRLDATNVVDQPLSTVICALGYDHMDRLGNTLGEIAGEKAGIIKEGCPLVLYRPSDATPDPAEAASALAVVQKKAKDLHALLTIVSSSDIREREQTERGQSFIYQRPGQKVGERYEIQLLGDYQAMNAALAIEACKSFATPAEIHEGLARATWPGRLELMRLQPPVLIDGAHNVQGCAGLAREISRRFAGSELIFVVGMLADKQHQDMLKMVLQAGQLKPASILCLRPPIARALAPEKLAAEAAEALGQPQQQCLQLSGKELADTLEMLYNQKDGFCPIVSCEDNEEGLLAALTLAESKGLPLVVFGSLYLLGQLRPILRRVLWADRDHRQE